MQVLRLDDRDRAFLAGEMGPAARMAMRIVTRMGELQGAASLLDIRRAHIDATIYVGPAGLEFAERLVEGGARVRVPTTLNVGGLDEAHWREWPVPADYAERALRQMKAYEAMGCRPTWTCAPYQTEPPPAFGEPIAWGESSAIVYANSFLGARTERYPDLLDICAAITGRVPAVGLHLEENRAGQLLLRLVGVPRRLQEHDAFYPVLGHLVGRLAGDRIPVLEGLEVVPTDDQKKALGAAAASSGAVALLHIVGVTPEAPTREAAFHGRRPAEEIVIDGPSLLEARRELTTATGGGVDLVALGSPHLSFDEFARLARLVDGERCHPRVRFVVTTSRAVAALAERAGYRERLERFGGRVTVDTCILATPMLPPDVRVVMTSSGKYAYYAPGLLGTDVVYGSMEDCVRSAIAGRIVRDEGPWDELRQAGAPC